MAKWRAIHKKISISGQVNRMSEFAQFLFERAMLHADDWGIVTGDPLELKLQAMPISERSVDEFDAALNEMEQQGLIWRYQPDGHDPLVQFITFDDHQPQVLIGNRTDPKTPLHYNHPNYADFPELQWKTLENAGTSTEDIEAVKESVEVIEKTSKSKSISRSKSSKSESKSEHQKIVAGLLERYAEGKEYPKRHKTQWKIETKETKLLVQAGYTADDVLACYDEYKRDPFWARKHLSLTTIRKNIGEWKKAGGKHGQRAARGKRKEAGQLSKEDREYFRQLEAD